MKQKIIETIQIEVVMKDKKTNDTISKHLYASHVVLTHYWNSLLKFAINENKAGRGLSNKSVARFRKQWIDNEYIQEKYKKELKYLHSHNFDSLGDTFRINWGEYLKKQKRKDVHVKFGRINFKSLESGFYFSEFKQATPKTETIESKKRSKEYEIKTGEKMPSKNKEYYLYPPVIKYCARTLTLPTLGDIKISQKGMRRLKKLRDSGYEIDFRNAKIIKKPSGKVIIHQVIEYEVEVFKKDLINKMVSIDINTSLDKQISCKIGKEYKHIGFSKKDMVEITKLEAEISELDKAIRKNKKHNRSEDSRDKLLKSRKQKYNRITNLSIENMRKNVILLLQYKQVNAEELTSSNWSSGLASTTNRRVSYLKPYMLKTFIRHKSCKTGTKTIWVDPYKTSKTCSSCWESNDELTVNDKKWECPHCGKYHGDRDFNSALVIEKIAMKKEKHPVLNNEKMKWKHSKAVQVFDLKQQKLIEVK